jgi:membrane protease YdiL (CAAX protease family)
MVAASVFVHQSPSLHWVLTAALPAFMLETLFYLGSLVQSSRSWFASLSGRTRKAAWVWVTALLPYLMFSSMAGTLTRNAFVLLALLSAVLAFWHAVLPRRLAYDIGFLVIAATPFIAKVFPRIYISPDEHLRMAILGQLMWIRVGVIALLVLREWNPGPVGLWPEKREWLLGALWFAIIVLPVSFTAIGVRDVRFLPMPYPWWKLAGIAIGTFFGFFWVVALAEELFFRGFIERAVLDWSRSPVLAVAISALVFGSAHLWFRHFPDWRQSVVASVLGLGCGLAYLQAGTIRASMVTHALTIVCWRLLFK